MGISITANNKITLLTFIFTIKKKDEKSISIIVIKQNGT